MQAAEPEIPTEARVVLAVVRCVFADRLRDFLAEIPMEQVRRAMREGLPTLLANLQGDERNVLLTLARMWRTAATGEFVTKDVAADWAVPHLPDQPAQTLLHARDAYLGEIKDDWTNRQEEVGKAAAYLHQQIISLL